MTSLEAVEIVYQHLKTSVLFTDLKKPNGGLYRFQRPTGSDREDVVVNSLTLNRNSIQQGVLNVNLFVPNLTLTFNGQQDKSQPNIKRLAELSLLAEQALKVVKMPNYTFRVQQDNLFPDENYQHYQSFRVSFNSINI